MTDKFEKGTGRDIDGWMEFLRSHHEGAADLHDLTHQQMAALAVDGGASEWWAQGIAVEVERIIGRRKVGQTVTGSVNAGASKTVPGEWRQVFEKFTAFMADGGEELLPADLATQPSTSATEKWRYWRASFTDGSSAALDCSDASTGDTVKTRLSMKHDKIPSMAQRDPVKAHWKQVLASFAASL